MISANFIKRFWIVLMGLFIITCSQNDDTPDFDTNCPEEFIVKNNRIVAFDILDPTETGSFTLNYEIASEELNAGFIQLLQPWNSFSPTAANAFNGPAVDLFQTLDHFASSTGTKLSLIITPIDIPGRFVPSELANKKFNDPEMIDGFIALINHLFNSESGIVNPENVLALSVGNEINHYDWSGNNDLQAEYQTFLENIKPHVNQYGIPLHFTGTLTGLVETPGVWTEMANAIDKLSITYYPLNPDFSVKQPDIIFDDFQNLISTFGDQPIFIQEIGYPSATRLNSSTQKQAAFFCNFFQVWDMYKDKITHTSILRLNDVSEASAKNTVQTYGILNDQNFIAYIQSLGIRTWEGIGQNKPAFETIRQELEKRSW